jgi:hypothetical protein
MAARGIVDLGDEFIVPQLLDDAMLSESPRAASRRALYPAVSPAGPSHVRFIGGSRSDDPVGAALAPASWIPWHRRTPHFYRQV